MKITPANLLLLGFEETGNPHVFHLEVNNKRFLMQLLDHPVEWEFDGRVVTTAKEIIGAAYQNGEIDERHHIQGKINDLFGDD